jgi:23S rRNA pseudouridine1911/1915/1917 synthase
VAKVRFIVDADEAGERLDRFLTGQLPDLSRARVQELIVEGRVHVNGATTRAAHRVQAGETIEAEPSPRPALHAEAEEIPLAILYEDADVVVVNKPAGMVVHAGAGKGAQHGTLVNALLGRYGKLSKGSEAGGLRPGIVHRLDKETSGCIVVARHDAAHAALAVQFEQRIVKKTYVALVHGAIEQTSGQVGYPIARHPSRRTRMTVRVSPSMRARAASTGWRVLLRLLPDKGRGPAGFSLMEVELKTGRTHQIRVHFCAIRHPIVGDTLYEAPARVVIGRETLPPLGRNFLHAARIRFIHPRTGAAVEVRAPLPAELRSYLERLARACGVSPVQIDAAASEYL